MGINSEFNPDLLLRAYGTPKKDPRECLPQEIVQGQTYEFLKKDQRHFWLEGEIPLRETKGRGWETASRPLASVVILESAHYFDKDRKSVMTRGKYRVIEKFDPNDPTIHFEGMNRIKR